MFILGTSSVMTYTGFDDLDLIGPVPQALSAGAHAFGAGTLVAPIAILMLVGRSIALVSIYFTGNTRLPMVAGWDNLLPGWFSRLAPPIQDPDQLHPVRRNCHTSLRYCESAWGRRAGGFPAHRQRRRDLLRHRLPRLVRHPDLRAARFARARTSLAGFMATIGLLVTLLYIVLSIVPIVHVESRIQFAAKIIITTVGANLLGALIFVAAQRRRRAAPAS